MKVMKIKMIKLIKPTVIPIFLLLIQCSLVKNEDINDNDLYLLKNNEVFPVDYNIFLDLSKPFSDDPANYNGVVNIAVKFKSTISNLTTNNPIKLHVKDIEAKSMKVAINERNGQSNIINPKIAVDNSTVEMLTLSFEDGITLDTKKEYNIKIEYIGKLHDDMYGLYRSEYKDENNETQWIATTQFQATHARRAFPCFDEPAQKAEFTIEVKHSSEYHALSNTAIDSTSSSGGIMTTKFKKTPKMSTYLIALVVSKFPKIARDNVDNINHGLYSPKEVIGTGQYAFQIAPKILNVMKEFTQVSYEESQLGKIDQVAIPDFSAGAMENWGLVTYRETALLWDPAESSSKNKERVATVVAHELAHMWFGNLITLEWWKYTWLNEGFARYYQYHATAGVEKDWELEKQFVVEQQQSVFIADANIKVDALTSDCYTPAQISSKFGTISYNKGASVIRMMEHFMGRSSFSSGIQRYFNTDSFFKNTNPDLLWNAMIPSIAATDEYLKTNFKDVMTAWTEQKGFPVVLISKVNSSHVSLSQKRFLYGAIDNETIWHIPITRATSDNPDFSKTIPEFWLDKKNPKINLPLKPETKWIIINIQASGYYRVHYDDDLYKLLENALKEKDFNKIPVLNRAQIVDDALNLARAGDVKYAVALDVVEYLKEELDYYPWYSAFNAFAYLKRRINSSSKLAELLDQYISLLMTEFYASVEFEEGFYNQIQNHKRVLALTWACELHDNNCISNSQERFKMLEEHGVEVDPNIRSVVYCTSIRNAPTDETWNYLWKRFETTTSGAESVTILTALGCSKDSAILKRYLELSVDPTSKIRSQDALTAFTAVLAGNQENVPVALTFLENNFKEIALNYGSLNALSSVITSLADRLTTQDQIDILKDFVKENKDELKDAAVVADTAILSAEDNLRWVEENEKVLVDYLTDKLYVGSASTKSTGLTVGTVLLIIYYYTNDLIFV